MTIQKSNSGLRGKRTLLAHFCPSGKSTVRKDVLVELDNRFELFTHLFPFKKGIYYFCYDYDFLPIEDKGIEKLLIVQKQDYMENLNLNPWQFKFYNIQKYLKSVSTNLFSLKNL